ncbi:putative e3 ubiquitin-protein ligase herc6 [Fusarium flagelliforme]|uniref:Putative e3 ubiquitin-protein ligase herc6 n=1 Tax=Fusarium flagelliforme TaxID=2675880 RepID=A0A395MXA1_9HYPO|nr:putative e3 ubiquitin-protein ligase herc6 [Fusarium flagelliforme]
MNLYAVGFNAWNQLSFYTTSNDEESDDLFAFTKVLVDKSVGHVVSKIYYTAVQQNDTWAFAGSCSSKLLYREADSTYLFDSPSAESGHGKVLTVQNLDFEHPTQAIVQYPSLATWRANRHTETWPCKSPVRQIAAYDTGFLILLENETVLSCGDLRFPDCLGREVDESCPAHMPCAVEDLNDLGESIKKVSAGGYTLGALTESGGLYLWGMKPPGSQSRHTAFTDLGPIPSYVEVDGEKDVQDFAIGEAHAIALTTDGCIYVIGDNTNGQIGLGKPVKESALWSKIDFILPPDEEVVAIEAGPRASFIVTAKTEST